MKYKSFLIFSLVVLFALLLSFVAAKPGSGVCPIQADTNVVFYGETGLGGVGDISKSWITHFFDWWKQQDPSIKYVILDSSDVKTDCNLANYPNVRVYVQPGGNAYYQQKKLGSYGKNNINNYIDSGRGYIGICAGFYYTAGDYYWQGDYYDWSYLLGKYPTVEGSITNIADYDENPGYALTGVSNGERMIYYGGPTRGWSQTPSDFPGEVLLSYTDISGNLPAAIKDQNMLLMSVHAEAYEDDGIVGLSTEQRLENYIWFANAINSVSGTNFFVPLPPNPPVCGNFVCEYGEEWKNCLSDCVTPQCADGIDNDWDNLTDYPNDPGCSSLEDDSEVESVGPVEVFFDGFESGSLIGWVTTAVSGGKIWMVSTTNPYEGTFYAQAQPMSTTDPASLLERPVSTVGYSNLKFSYSRRLVGLDIADEFRAKWYDGSNWFILEQTGSSSVNDASYVYKEFTLPLSANNNSNFRIKFECTAGATSEYCRVDNVKLTAN